MKTFQTAIATSLHFLKLPIILLALFFNFSIGEPLPIPIGGNSVPRHFAQSSVVTGGPNGSPIDPIDGHLGGTETRRFALNSIEIGGPGTESRKLLDIGGGQNAPRQPYVAIGGNGSGSTAPRNVVQATALTSAKIDLPIGGTQGVPRQLTAIGGSQTVPHTLVEIGGGGNETRKVLDLPGIGGIGGGQTPPRALKTEFLKITVIELPIGGAQGAPRQLNAEIGGNNGPVGPRNLIQIGSCTVAAIEVPIGGTQNVPRPLMEIGGGQLAPREIGGSQETRKIADIGGQQTAPRTFRIEIGGNSCPRC